MGVTKHIDTRMRWTWSKNLPTTLSPPPNSSSTVLTAWLEEMGINIKFSSFRNLVSVSGTALDHSGYTGEKKTAQNLPRCCLRCLLGPWPIHQSSLTAAPEILEVGVKSRAGGSPFIYCTILVILSDQSQSRHWTYLLDLYGIFIQCLFGFVSDEAMYLLQKQHS